MASTIHSIISKLHGEVKKEKERSVTSCFPFVEKEFGEFISECEKTLKKATYKSFFSACNRIKDAGSDSAMLLSGLDKLKDNLENMLVGEDMEEGDREKTACLGDESAKDDELIKNINSLIKREKKLTKDSTAGVSGWIRFTGDMCSKSAGYSLATFSTGEDNIGELKTRFSFFQERWSDVCEVKTLKACSGLLRKAAVAFGAENKEAGLIGKAADNLLSCIEETADELKKLSDTKNVKKIMVVLNKFAACCNVLGKKLSVCEKAKSFAKLIKNLEKTRSYAAKIAKKIKNA